MFWLRAKVPAQSQGSVMTQQPILEKGRNVGLGRKDNKCQGENTKKLPLESCKKYEISKKFLF